MKKKTTAGGMETGIAYRRRKRQKGICIALRIFMAAALLICVWFIDLSCALGLIRNAKAGENWPASFAGYGEMMLGGIVVLTASVVLVLFRRCFLSMGATAVGTVLFLIPTIRMVQYAGDNGFYSRIMDMPADTLYCLELLPTLAVPVCVIVLALLQYFSVDARARRREKAKQAERPAPPIVED